MPRLPFSRLSVAVRVVRAAGASEPTVTATTDVAVVDVGLPVQRMEDLPRSKTSTTDGIPFFGWRERA